MNITTKRLLIGGGTVILGAYALLCVMDVWDAQARLRLDQDDLREIRQKLDEIRSVENAPKVAALDVESPDEIINRLNEALDATGLKRTLLANHTPNAPIPIKNSDFVVRTIDISLNAASVQKIVAFCEALRDESTGSVVRDLRLYEPRKTPRGETWASQMVLTQIIFSPKSNS